MNVLVPLADGVEELEAVTIVDVLRRSGLKVTTVSIGLETRVMASRGVTLLADALWQNIDTLSYDVIAIPGGGGGTDRLASDERVMELLQRFNDEGKMIAAICAAPTILVRAGILMNRRATCYPTCAHVLGDAYENAPVVVDGNIVTSQGPGTAMLFALVLIRYLVGNEVAEQVAQGMLTKI